MSVQSDNSLNSEIAYGVDLDLPIAGLGGRAYAFLIDWHIRLLLSCAWLALCFFVIFPIIYSTVVSFDQLDDVPLAFGILAFPSLAIYFLYHPFLEIITGGSSPGKRMAGIRIVNSQGLRPDVSALVVRNIFRLIDSLPGFYVVGMVATIVSGQKLRIGDMAAQTILIYEDKVGSADLQRAVQLRRTHSGDMSDDQLEILNELLSRWKQLKRDVRCRHAEKLLDKIGVSIAHESRERERDVLLHDKLKSLI